MSINKSQWLDILFQNLEDKEYSKNAIQDDLDDKEPGDAMYKLEMNPLIRLYLDSKKNLYPQEDKDDAVEAEAFKPALNTLLEQIEGICKIEEDRDFAIKYSPAARLELLNHVDKIFNDLADRNSQLAGNAFGEIIVDHKVKIDAVRAEMEEKLAKTNPNHELLEKSKKDCMSIFNKPGTPEANNLKRISELYHCGNVNGLDVFRANWNYLRLKDSTPWTDFGKRRVSGAVQNMAEFVTGMLKPDPNAPEENRQEVYHAAQLECMRNHEFRKLIVEQVQEEMGYPEPDVSKENMALYALACEVEHAYPGKNGPASGKMPAGSAREKAAEETLKKVQSALEKTYGPGMENLTVEAMKAPGKDGGLSLVEELAQKAFPAPKEVKAEPKPERTSNVSQL